MTTLEIIILFSGIFLSFTFLQLVDFFGIKLPLQLIIPGISLVATLVYILLKVDGDFFYLSVGFLTTPILVFLLFHFFDWLSLLLHKETLRLHYRGATNRKHQVLYGITGKPYKITDTLFTFIITLAIMLWAPLFASLCVHFVK
ncbi:hypothetical protein ACFOWM_06000 [Ferruginibacter yonginensis]|uniref:Uncharacterized protein n=1 Tax=Ferruginibacter yonginensis TaxID=1310416 RepID=A0ABV8QRW6_9BACT